MKKSLLFNYASTSVQTNGALRVAANTNNWTFPGTRVFPPHRRFKYIPGTIQGRINTFGATDQFLKMQVYWLQPRTNQYPYFHASNPALTTWEWVADPELVFYVMADDSSTTKEIPFSFDIPYYRSKDWTLDCVAFNSGGASTIITWGGFGELIKNEN